MEIEAATSEEIKEYITKLGLDSHTQKKFGSRKLYEHYGLEYSYFD
jgi:hypothetical protein